MASKRNVILFFLALAVLFMVFALWYKTTYSMSIAQAYEVNSPSLERRLLIATQGSAFKNKLTEDLVEYYKSDSIFIKVIDISALPTINADHFTAMVILHTWENWKPPQVVATFIDKTADSKTPLVVLTTSGNGTYKMDRVDAITGASQLDQTNLYLIQITQRLKPYFKF